MTRTCWAMALGAALTLAAGCATTAPVPAENLAHARASVRAAHQVGTESVPEASYHLDLAEEQLASARMMLMHGHNSRATMVLARAEADAALAHALSREHATREAADRATAEVRTLQRSMR